jgi:hypothetical protein
MYVINPDVLKLDTLYSCNKVIADWLGKQKIPFISQDAIKGVFYFTKTEALKEALERMPISVRLHSYVSQ